jgi:site-specific DNA-methyltransferase (adenine-specific)
VSKRNAAVVLTASQPFTSTLVVSNIADFRYCLVWDKGYSTGYGNANKMPMKAHEDLCVFYMALPTYNPQGVQPCGIVNKRGRVDEALGTNGLVESKYVQKLTGYPRSILSTKKERGGLHPTQKPVALMEYLIRTYTNPGDTVLDNCMGSGTTGVACVHTGRSFIGIEKDPAYFGVAKARIEAAQKEQDNTHPTLFQFNKNGEYVGTDKTT